MATAEILISITGMGDPDDGDTDAWAQTVFPTGTMFASGGRKWLQFPNGRQIYLLEVLYEDVNDAMLAKYEGMTDAFFGWAPDMIEKKLEEYLGDVVVNVLSDVTMDMTQRRFVAAYAKAVQLATSVVGMDGDIRTAKVGVLSHSLGTLVAYEGLYRTYDTSDFLRFIPVNLVMCAPMLRPICGVQAFLQKKRYLAQRKCQRPSRTNPVTGKSESIVRQAIAFYDRRDPFYLIHADSFYDNTKPNQDLVDRFVTFETKPKFPWMAHAMTDSYLANNRAAIAEFLFA
jgi:hypothetical protein